MSKVSNFIINQRYIAKNSAKSIYNRIIDKVYKKIIKEIEKVSLDGKYMIKMILINHEDYSYILNYLRVSPETDNLKKIMDKFIKDLIYDDLIGCSIVYIDYMEFIISWNEDI